MVIAEGLTALKDELKGAIQGYFVTMSSAHSHASCGGEGLTCLQEWLCVLGPREGVPRGSTSEVSRRTGGPEHRRTCVAAAQGCLVVHCSIQQEGTQAWVLVVHVESQGCPCWTGLSYLLDQGLWPGVACADGLNGSGGGAGAGLSGTRGKSRPYSKHLCADSFPPVRQVLFPPFYRWGH